MHVWRYSEELNVKCVIEQSCGCGSGVRRCGRLRNLNVVGVEMGREE